jgi:hypothetical protein
VHKGFSGVETELAVLQKNPGPTPSKATTVSLYNAASPLAQTISIVTMKGA